MSVQAHRYLRKAVSPLKIAESPPTPLESQLLPIHEGPKNHIPRRMGNRNMRESRWQNDKLLRERYKAYLNDNIEGYYQSKQPHAANEAVNTPIRPPLVSPIRKPSSVYNLTGLNSETEILKQHTQRPKIYESSEVFKIRRRKKKSISSISMTMPLSDGIKLFADRKYTLALQIFVNAITAHPENIENYYYSALCHFNLHEYAKGLSNLLHLINKLPNFKPSIYLLAATAIKDIFEQKTKDPSHALVNKLLGKEPSLLLAIDMINRGLVHFPQFFEYYFSRAKLQEKVGNFTAAVEDLKLFFQRKSDSLEAHIFGANLFSKLDYRSNAIESINNALELDRDAKYRSELLLIRAGISFKNSNLSEMESDLMQLQTLGNCHPQVFFLRGQLNLSKGLLKEAVLAFQKVLKLDQKLDSSHCSLFSDSLIAITRIKIRERDFYSARHQISRAASLKLTENKDIQIYSYFVEGVVSMMKRQVEGGIDCLNLIENQALSDQFLGKIYYLYRAFGNFMLFNHEKAINDYHNATGKLRLDNGAQYNLRLAEGIVAIKRRSFDQGLKIFQELQLLHPSKIDPLLYRSCAFIERAKLDKDDLHRLEDIFIALKELDAGHERNDSHSNLLHLRALIYLYIGKFQDALQDIIKAITKSEENVPKYFYLRALINSALENWKQALNDINICINLDEKFAEAYLLKAKLNYHLQGKQKCLEDLYKYASLSPSEDLAYLEACLYFVNGSVEEAKSALAKDRQRPNQNIEKRKLLMNYLLLYSKNFETIKSGLIHVTKPIDRYILAILNSLCEPEKLLKLDLPTDQGLELFTMVHYHFYNGLRWLLLGDFAMAAQSFRLALKERSLCDLEKGIIISPSAESEDLDQAVLLTDPELHSERQLTIIQYNICLCEIFLGNHQRAYDILIRNIIPVISKEQDLSDLISLLVSKLRKLPRYSSNNDQTTTAITQHQSKVIFDQNIKKKVSFQLFKHGMQGLEPKLPILDAFGVQVEYSLSLLLPFCEQITQFGTKPTPNFVLSKLLCLQQVDNKPEPPWVKRTDGGALIFTSDLNNQSIDIELKTTEPASEEQDGEEDHEEEEEQEEQEEQKQDQEESDLDPADEDEPQEKLAKWKNKMKLGDSIERKLQKIMAKKSPSNL